MYLSAVHVEDALFCTVRDVKAIELVGPNKGGYRYTYSFGGSSYILFYNCLAKEGRHTFAVGARTMGPNAYVKCRALNGGASEPHHRWGVGTLYDCMNFTKSGSVNAFNRGDSGSGHGWAAANTVVWNAAVKSVVVFDPETVGENNFAIGYAGSMKKGIDTDQLWYANTRAGYWGTPREGVFYGYALMGNGHIESPDKPVKPTSLFRQQLIDRIGRKKADAVLK